MTFRIPRKKTYPYSDTPKKKHQKFCRHVERPPPFPAPCRLSPPWPSGYNTRLATQRSRVRAPAPTFFSFFGSPQGLLKASSRPPQGLLKASPGPSRLLPLREQQPGVEHGSVRTRVRPPAAARAVGNALTHYHTNVWLYS